MPLSHNRFYQGAAIAGIIAIVLDLPLLYYLDVGAGDVLILVAAALGIGAGFTENKGMMIGAMVMSILATVWMAFSSLLLLIGAGVCDAASDAVDEGHSCWGCDTTAKCATAGCEWTPSYTEYNTAYDASGNEIGTQLGGSGDSGAVNAVCSDGVDGFTVANEDCSCNAALVAAGAATVASPHDLTSCDAECGQTYDFAATQTWANTGCDHAEHKDAKELGKFCDALALVTFLVVVELILMLGISICGCCVACCDKDVIRDGSKDDDDSG